MHSQGLGQEREDGTLSPERALKRQRVSVPSVAIGCGEADTLWAKIHVKHPHERGEEITADWIASGPLETPPRAWGGVVQQQLQQYDSGNTPTNVGRRA